MRAWEEFLTQQEKELGLETVQKWLRPLKIIRFDACNLYLEAADSFQSIWFEEHMRHRVQSTLFNNNRKPIKIHLSVVSEQQEATPWRKKATGTHSAGQPFSLRFDDLDPHARLDTYATCHNNVLAYKLLCEVCGIDPETLKPSENRQLSLSFNPIYLFGRPGTGKTHLLMATANQLKKEKKKVLYVRADTFTEHVVGAIRTGEMQQFRRAYRNVDALFIDDIEVFAHKGATQEEFFHTFNTLHLDNKQIFLSATSSPQDLKFIEPRLISRFEWGIVIPLQMPDRQQMQTILEKRAERLEFALDDVSKTFLLDTFGHNTTSLTRALEALVLRTHLNRGLGNNSPPPTAKSLQNLLSDLIQEEEKALLTPGKIIRTVAEYYGIRMDDILSKSQSRDCALPRQVAMHLCRQELSLPFMKIGDIFSRDHSTVMSSVRQIQKGLEAKNQEITGPIRGILKLLEPQR